MRRFLSFVFILFLAVVCSSCINTLAVQKLNNASIEYINQGDIEKAISRLEASLELDENVYETRYNLANAYMKLKKYDLAIEQLNTASKINPKEADTYYALAVAYDSSADEIYENSKEKNEEIINLYFSDLNSAILNYNKYLELSSDADDKDSVEERVQILKQKLTEENLTENANNS